MQPSSAPCALAELFNLMIKLGHVSKALTIHVLYQYLRAGVTFMANQQQSMTFVEYQSVLYYLKSWSIAYLTDTIVFLLPVTVSLALSEPGPISQYVPSSRPAAHDARRLDARDRRQTTSSLNAP